MSDALKERKTAENALKTSFFGNWNSDNDTAAHHFEKAGQLFKLGKSFSESLACYKKAAGYYEASRVLFSVGKCNEAAAQCCKELGNSEEAHAYIVRAGDFFTQNGTSTSAVQCYIKGAEALAGSLPKEAAELYMRAGQLERDNDHVREAIKCLTGAKKIYARGKFYKECIAATQLCRELYEELESPEHVRKCNLTLVILHLARGDSIAARQSISGNVSGVADELINAVDAGDEDEISKLSTHGDVVYLDNEIARIAKFLSQDGAEVPAKAQPGPVKPVPTPATNSIFKSSPSSKTSNGSQRNELFARPNRQNRDELFAKTKADPSNERSELFSGPVSRPQQPVASPAQPVSEPHVPKHAVVEPNPFDGPDSEDHLDSNPFGATESGENSVQNIPEYSEAVQSTNPFADDEEEDLC